MTVHSPRESGRFIAEHSEHVKVNNTGVDRIAQMVSFYIKAQFIEMVNWNVCIIARKLIKGDPKSKYKMDEV